MGVRTFSKSGPASGCFSVSLFFCYRPRITGTIFVDENRKPVILAFQFLKIFDIRQPDNASKLCFSLSDVYDKALKRRA